MASGVDFDDPDFGFKEEDKPRLKVCLCFGLLKGTFLMF